MNILVVGCGRWGSFISWYLDKINHNVTLYGRESSEKFKKLTTTKSNGIIKLSDKVKITSDIKSSINRNDIIIISIGAQKLREFLNTISRYELKNKIIVLCMKGIEKETGKRLTQITKECLGKIQTAIWVGPGHAQDFVKGIPNCMVIDSENQKVKEFLVKNFSSDLIRFYIGNDLIGNEIGAAAKNVMGIAAGMLDGLGYPSLKGALMSRGTREIARLINKMGGHEMSAYGLCHLGDYEATLFSKHSNNRQFGENFVNNIPFQNLAEGAYTVSALLLLAKVHNVELPICNAVNDVVNNHVDPKNKLQSLFLRSIKSEF